MGLISQICDLACKLDLKELGRNLGGDLRVSYDNFWDLTKLLTTRFRSNTETSLFWLYNTIHSTNAGRYSRPHKSSPMRYFFQCAR